ncbi:MAG TPA: ATP-binding protein [Abditibacteriaceae bacterium]|jgi:hypothetical protein
MNAHAADNQWSEFTWHEANQCYLMTALAELRGTLERHIASTRGEVCEDASVHSAASTAATENALEKIRSAMSAPPALEALCAAFRLSAFERDVLLLSAGPELDSSFARLCAVAQGDAQRTYPTFSLALSALPGAHWSALTPAAPLRHWRLLELVSNPIDMALTLSPLRIDECTLHYLAGTPHLDERLTGLMEMLRPGSELVPSHQELAARLVAAWSQSNGSLPIIQLCGAESLSKRAIAAAACSALGLSLYILPAYAVPVAANEIESLLRLWEREAALRPSALLLDCEYSDTPDAARALTVMRLMESIRSPLIVSAHERLRTSPSVSRTILTFDVRKPSASEQRLVWGSALGVAESEMNGKMASLVSQFNLNVPLIHAACADALSSLSRDGEPPISSRAAASQLDDSLWDACRVQARTQLNDLAQRIEPAATWDELVLPQSQRQVLHDIAMHVRQRSKVYEHWGFARKGTRGLGISALFAGQSGTGKTMAAEVLANELRLDLYLIDLSSVVSKYIGETEKNLRRVFDAAEEGGAILLFDEADALFGKRSEVKDSHDRYANIEISYLLQRMESYRGLAILTTNMKDALDTAFLRRIQFVVQFPFPDAAQRTEIWQRIFPASTPTANLDAAKLARLNVAGGNIRNIAINAAFGAADENSPVQMSHLLQAARAEYSKLERTLTEAESGGWT